MLHKAGCGGFPVGKANYFKALSTVEISSTFYNPPKLATAEKWRLEAPKGFEYSLRAWQLITHPATIISFDKLSQEIPEKRKAFCGHFKPTSEVESAWESTQSVAEALGARFVVFETPTTFYPDSNHIKDMYQFFKSIRRRELSLVWQPQGNWEPRMLGKICADLDLIHGVDPLQAKPARGAVNYFRLGGRNRLYSDADKKEILALCEDKPSYVYFSNLASWRDARALSQLGKS